MSPLAALRHRRSSPDLPPATSDVELLAWSSSLTRRRPPRTEPLRAPGRATVLSTVELFEEIERRATAAAPARMRLYRPTTAVRR